MCKFYLDEDLAGRTFVEVLRTAGLALVTSSEMGLDGSPDAHWIPIVTNMEYVILSGDVRTRYIEAEKRALRTAGARMIYVKQGKKTTHSELAKNLVNTRRQIVRFIRRTPAPWLITLSRPSDINLIAKGKPGRLNRNLL